MKQFIVIALLTMGLAFTAIGQQEQPKRCKALTTKGTQCHNRAEPGKDYCKMHDPTLQCGAKTSKGTPCKRHVDKAGQHCWQHTDSN